MRLIFYYCNEIHFLFLFPSIDGKEKEVSSGKTKARQTKRG